MKLDPSLDPFLAEFDRLTQGLLGTASRASRSDGMPMDVVRRGDAVIVSLDLPGVAQEALEVTVDGHVLTIAAERPLQQQDGDTVYLRGRAYGAVKRQLTLPDDLDVDRIEASFEHGVLELRIPVAERAKPRRISLGGKAAQPQIDA